MITMASAGATVFAGLTSLVLWQDATDQVAERIRTRLEQPAAPFVSGDEPLFAETALRQFYVARVYRPAWTGSASFAGRARELMTSLERLADDGLDPSVYHLEAIRAALDDVQRSGAVADVRWTAEIDLLLTDAFLLAASHLLSGRVSPETIHSEWVANRREGNMAVVLEQALEGGGIAETLDSLRPRHDGYRRLRSALREHRVIVNEGGWGRVPPGPVLRVGDDDARVGALRRRLRASGELRGAGSERGTVLDSAVAAALAAFQRRHGLPATEALDSATVAELNVPAEDRARQLALNLERWRWLPQELGARHILVNIAAFELEVVEQGIPVMEMRVVTGRPYRRTPVFTGEMTYVVIRPYWHVPHNIAVQDKLPLIKRDRGYLARYGYTLWSGWGADAVEVDPLTVDWSQVTASSFPYRLRQDPGPYNALGDVKFMFPNRFNVYLHDTPDRELFERDSRDFSSGCIRLQRPLDLLRYLLQDQPQWTEEATGTVLASRTERTVRLTRPIPVHLLYWTAWVDADGTVQFRRDIYDRDPPVAAALAERPR